MDKPEFRVIIAGSRGFSDYDLLRTKCDRILSGISTGRQIVVVSGTARGADQLGERYARERGFAVRQFPADWERHGKQAGYLRNREMAEHADALIAFWDGQSHGTKMMIEIAMRKGLMVRTINRNPQDRAIAEANAKIAKLRAETSRYAVEHITGNGLHTGVRWLQDSFNEYYNSIRTPGIRISQESEIGHRQILAQKVAIDCIHALSHEQLERLDKVLGDIAKDVKVDNKIKL